MKKGIIFLVTVMLIALTSCNKNQKAVKVLDGSWELIKINDNAIVAEDGETVTFSSCKLKKEEFCSVVTKFADGDVDNGEYKVGDDGETLIVKDIIGTLTVELKAVINELSNDKLVYTIDFLGDTDKYEYKKI